MRNPVRSRRRALVGVALCTGMLASACASSGPSLEIGFRRIALDLSFKDQELAEPVPAQEIIRRVITAEPVEIEEVNDRGPRVVRVVRTVPSEPDTECREAPEGLAPEEPAFPVVKAPPRVGVYDRHNEGALTIETPTQTFELPVPRSSQWEIPSVEEITDIPTVAERDAEELGVPDAAREESGLGEPMTEFSVTRHLVRGYWVTDTYRYTNGNDDGSGAAGNATADFLHLVKRVTVAQGEESVFEPTPPIRLLRLNTPEGNMAESGTSHGGVDRRTNVAMTVQSQIIGRELVDVCGEIVDTYRVEMKEQFVDMEKNPPETSGNEGETANYWNIQFDNGLLVVRAEVNSTARTTTEVLGQRVPVTIRYQYTSTLDSLEPEPFPDEAQAGGA